MTKRRKDNVSADTFAELMESAEQALAYERGERAYCRVTQVSSRRAGTSSCEVELVKSVLKIQHDHKKPSNK
jgi:hypothetical protein